MKRLAILVLTVIAVVAVIGGILVVQRGSNARMGIAKIVMQNRSDLENACWKQDMLGNWEFSNAAYYSVLRKIDASSCSQEFQTAWQSYVDAVRARSESSPIEKIHGQIAGASGKDARGHPRAVSEAWVKFEAAARSAGAIE